MNNNTNATLSPYREIKDEPGLLFVVLACALSSLWILFLGFYWSRFSGTIITRILNKFFVPKDAYIKIGSISVSVVSGKLMFRDVLYVTRDLTFRVVDGYAIFHWWQKYIPKTGNGEDGGNGADKQRPCRLTVYLNGFEFHIYNRSDLYDKLQDLYKKDRYGDAHKSTEISPGNNDDDSSPVDPHGKYQWRDLIPAIKFKINTAKIAFGNKMVERTLYFHFESADAQYEVTEPSSFLDQFAHKIVCDCKNVRVMLAPTNGYTGSKEDPPRYMGEEGFVVLKTQACKLNYIQDEPGIVPEITTENEMTIETDPTWLLDVSFSKAASISYGPWADRQREQLQKFFFPLDYQELPVNKGVGPGQRRQHSGLDIRLDFKCDSNLELLFTKDQETQAIHVCVGMDSRIRIYQPWRVNEYGYMSSIVANLRQVEASTGLDFRQLIEAEEVKLTVHITIARIWNHTQHWSADITLYKATWFFLFAHKRFFQDFSNDWATKTPPDLLTFVPYEWSINIGLRDFEMIWLANDYNWIDCSTNCQENAEVALCGESLDLYFGLPYTCFLPEMEEIKFVIQVERLVGRLNIPESSTLRRSFLALAREQCRRSACSSTSATVDQDGLESADEQLLFADDTEFSGGWRRHTEISKDWVNVFSTPTLSLIISYIYHPIICGETFECVLGRHNECTQDNAKSPFDLHPDIINVEIEANSCAFKLVGMLLKALANIKENYFGAYQEFREFDARSLSKMKRTIISEYGENDNTDKEVVDKLSLRPMEANIIVNLCSIKAELTKNCSFEEGLSPLLLMDRLTFEMHKTFSETQLQLQLSPTTIYAYDGVQRTIANKHLGQGFLHLSGLQLRGHAMFSEEDRPIHCETLEYAWLIELQLGTLCGKISLPQLQAVYTWAELFMFHFSDEENILQDPVPVKTCQHGLLQTKCGKVSKTGENGEDQSLCPTEDDFKYKFTRISIEQVDLCLVEACCCCNVKLSSTRLATCNLHSNEAELGITFLLSKVEVYQYVLSLSVNKLKNQMHITPEQACWLEAGSVNFGPVVSDVSIGQPLSIVASDQKEFLEKHDKKSRRLWFLWKQVSQHNKRTSKDKRCCGCVGGCSFFGKNLNGGEFFKGGILDGAYQERQGRGFGSPDGWQNKRDKRDSVFEDKSENTLHRHNSWAGRAHTLSRLGVASDDRRLRSETHSGGFDSNKETCNAPESSKRFLGTGVANAWSVPDSFQRIASSSTKMFDRDITQKAILVNVSDRERKPSDSSFYSCSSALGRNASQTPSLMSLDSFTSAVETSDQLTFSITDDFQEQFILLPNVLLSKYKENLVHFHCNNWFNDDIPRPNKRFDVMQNLRVIDQRQSTCPTRLQFTTRNHSSDKYGLLMKKENGKSMTDQATSPKVEQKMTDLRQVVLLRDSDNMDSEKLSGKMDTLKRRRWRTEINDESPKSVSSRHNKTRFAEEISMPQETIKAIMKVEGFANIMFTPLLFEAFQRYTKSVSEQLSLLHPCSVLDKIHIKSIDVAMKKYKLEQLLSDIGHKKNGVTTNAFLTVPGVNICFIQAFTSECSVSSILHSRDGSESDLSESGHHPNPSLSLLAIHIDNISGQMIRRDQPHRQITDKTQQLDVNLETITKEGTLGLDHEKYGGEKRDSEISCSFNINQIQIQFSRLSKKSDFEDSHTTAIPPKMSKVDFRYANDNVVQFSKDLDIKDLRKENFVIFIMLECGIEKSSLKFGNSSLVKDTGKERPQAVSTPKKSGHSRSQSAPAQLLTKVMRDADECDNKLNVSHGILHENYSEQVLEGIVVEKSPGCIVSPIANDSASSISSSSSRITHSDSTGELTDNESEGEDEPLLRKTGTLPMSTTEKLPATMYDVTDGRPKKPAFSLNRKSDAVINFTCIWFNCASPSSVKPVPENYHLHNNLLTTAVPAVSSWMPGVEKMKLLLNQLQNNQRKRYYLVTASIMAQGLPDKMLCSHNVINKASKQSKYLQTDYSSQLIFNLRRQLTGSRKQKVFNALSDISCTPTIENLSKGIMALSRQWKCVLGVTEEEFVFRPAGYLKRPVVGRGVLTERDRAILMSMGKQQTETFAEDQYENQNQTEMTDVLTAAVSPVVAQQFSTSELLSNKLSSSISSLSSSEEDSTLHSGKARFKRKKGLSPRNDTEQSLYSWFSSPVASPRSSKNDYTILDKNEITTPTVTWAKDPKDDDDLFGQMVSQPTSGKQIADEKVIFKAFFLGIGFLQPSDEFTGSSYESYSLHVRLKCLRLDIADGKYDFLRRKIPKIDIPISNNTDQQINTPSFVIKSFETKVSVRNTPLCDYNNGRDQTRFIRKDKKDEMQHSVVVIVGCHTATQNINLSLIRFSLQVADVFDIIGENYRGVKAVKHSPVDLLNNTESGSASSSRGDSQKCWRIMYQVSNLYSALPTENTQKLTARPQDCKINLSECKPDRPPLLRTISSPKDIRFVASRSSRTLPKFKLVFVISLQKLRCITTLGELCLRTDLNSINLCISHKIEEHHGTLIKKALLEACNRKISTTSVSFHLQKTSLVLSETGDGNGIVVSCVLNPSHGIYSCVDQKDDTKKKLLFTFGILDVDIPQHPVALHCMMTRSSKTLSKQISELQSQRSVIRTFSSLERSSLVEISRDKVTEQVVDNTSSTQVLKNDMDVTDSGVAQQQVDGKVESNFPNMSVTVVLKGFSVGASLLPSLKVEYKIGTVISCGQTGRENVFKLDMPQHHLSFTSKVKSLDSSIPASTSIELPRVDICGTLDVLRTTRSASDRKNESSNIKNEKKHLTIVADIGTFNQHLSTDLLNHLIFIQKGFMKEVNDVLQRVSGESQPIPLWRSASTDDMDSTDKAHFLSFSFTLNLKNIEITATTPSSTAVRLETGVVNLKMSNRDIAIVESRGDSEGQIKQNSKVLVVAEVDLTLSLGQFFKQEQQQFMLETTDFQQLAFFKTQVRVANSGQDEVQSEEKETLLVSVFKPSVYVEPIAFDKAVLLYLNYKNAYAYWNEQRMTLTEDVQFATQAVFEKLPQRNPSGQLSGFLFLQLTVSNLGLCLPLLTLNQEQPVVTALGTGEVSSALVLTMENMLLTCCSSASFVSKGSFKHFCVRFTEKFDVKKSDWKPSNACVNSCMVPDGTYEICSRTIRQPYANDATKAGKMAMSLKWEMCGIDVHCDAEIGKPLKELGQTLTAVAGDSDIANLESVAEDTEAQIKKEYGTPAHHEEQDDVFDETDSKPYMKNLQPQKLEKEMWQQARKVNELRRKPKVDVKELRTETGVLQELENAVYNEFRRDVKRKFERQSHRSLFSVADGGRPTKMTSAPDKMKRPSTLKFPSTTRPLNGFDQIDSGKSSEMISLTSSNNLVVSPRSWKAPMSDLSISNSQEISGDVQTHTLSPAVHDSGSGLQVPSSPSRQYSTRPKSNEHAYSTPANTQNVSFMSQKSTTVEQDLDFDLDVMINIESGKCVFHSTPDTKTDNSDSRTYPSRTHDAVRMTFSGGQRHRQKTGMKGQDDVSDSSTILLPGVEARVHYSSETSSENLSSFTLNSSDTATGPNVFSPGTADTSMGLRKTGKHASLYISLLVQPLPKEMLLRPSLLDFIDKALNPIVTSMDFDTEEHSLVHNNIPKAENELDPATGSFISSATSEHSSFPVDIVIVARVQPSNIRISCLPASRVECLMRIPSLDLSYSSNPSPNKTCKSYMRNQSLTHDVRNLQRSGSDNGASHYDSGGISFSICLSRFSLFIYHPYGKQHSVATKTNSLPEDNAGVSPKARVNVSQPEAVSGKKDALSLSLEFIKFNLFRRRFGDFSTSVRHEKLDEVSVESTTLVKVSALCDIGSATFTYDMRRLQEILDFPRCWHKRGLLSRLFLGKEGTYATKSANVPAADTTDGSVISGITSSASMTATPEKAQHPLSSPLGHRRTISTPLPGILPFLSSPNMFGANTHTSVSKSESKRNDHQTSIDVAVDSSEADTTKRGSSMASATSKWETVVVLGISLSRLDVSTNMANVMGKTVWSTSDLRASGNLRLTNSGERTLRSKLSIRQSTWESRGGIAGGHIELQDISSYVNVSERRGSEPEHSGNVRFRYCETRIDYMGTCILMGNLSSFRISMMDEWKTSNIKSSSTDNLLNDNESPTVVTKAKIYLRGNLHWKNVRLVICRSTTSDLIKMIHKIEAFFTQQANSSVMLLSSMSRPTDYGDVVSSLSNPLSKPVQGKHEKGSQNDGLKYQHWSKALSTISNFKSAALSYVLPEKGAVIGGSLELSGWEVLLACFHGLNFRSQTWALFSISQPSATFSSKVGCVEKSCQVRRARSVQKLSFRLGGQNQSSAKSNDPQEAAHMGMICKVERGRRNPPSMGSSVAEWLSYVSSVNNVSVQPSQSGDVSPPPRSKPETDSTAYTPRRRNKSVSAGATYRYEHDSEAIFGLPSFQVDLTTEHDQPIRVKFSTGDKLPESWPVTTSSPHIVECSLESCFYDSLYVTMDVGLLFFLHEIIQTYVKENESATTTMMSQGFQATRDPNIKDNDIDATVQHKKKIRQFRSKCWKLEPTVRFLSWAGRRVEGVNIDWVLEKLGFSHARLTIPKWVQRGAMDPMDRFLSLLLYHLLLAVEENSKK